MMMMIGPRAPRLHLGVLGLALLALLGAPVARANDRPYQVARTAVLDDDEEEHVWSFESWVQRLGSVRGASVEPEYTFGSGVSMQAELTRYVDRRGNETGHEAEVEWKRVFNEIEHDGWGWGLSGALSVERTREGGRTIPGASIKVPVSIALGQDGGFLHVNAGVGKARGERLDWTGALGIERELIRRSVFFGEFARSRDTTFLQAGVRHWVRREKLALDFSLQRQTVAGSRGTGFIIGLGWYDL